MKIRYEIINLLLVISFVSPENVKAECKGSQNLPSEQVHIAFNVSDAGIKISERERLKKWISEINSRYIIQHWVTIIGSASQGEKNANNLATSRAVAVAKDAIEDGLINAPLQIKTQIYPIGNPDGLSEETREVTIQVSPGCPNNCCDSH
jgi:hypothetical protein